MTPPTTGPETTLASSATPPPETPPSAGAPETYADFKLPDGFAFEGKTLDDARALFKELNLPQEAAQKLVDFQAARDAAGRDANMRAINEMRAGWRDAVKADPDLGPNLDKVLVNIGRAYTRMDPAVVNDFKAAMDLTGAGDNPAILKGFNAFATLINEGTHVAGGGPSPAGQTPPKSPARPTAAQAMYPNHPFAATPTTTQ